MPNRFKLIMAVALIGLLVAAAPAEAHKIKVFAAWENDRIAGYAYAPGGVRIKGTQVELIGPDGNSVGKATSDDQGNFSFPVKDQGRYKIILDLGDGHRGEFTVRVGTAPQAARPAGPAKAAAPTAGPGLDPAAVEAAVERAIGRRLTPVLAKLDQLEDRIGLRDVVGGLGYIIGLMGLAAFFKSKNRAGGGKAD